MPDCAGRSIESSPCRRRLIIWLYSLLKNCGIESDASCDLNITAIDNVEGRTVVNLLAMFDEMVHRAYDDLEPSVIANYLFELK